MNLGFVELKEFGENLFLGNSLTAWSVAFLVGVLVFATMRLIVGRVLKILLRWAEKTDSFLDDAVIFSLRSTHPAFFFGVSAVAAAHFLKLPPWVGDRLSHVFVLLLIFQGAIWVSRAIAVWAKKTHDAQSVLANGDVGAYWAIGFGGRMLVWVLAVLLVLDNLGINVSTLITGLGIGGIAVALAVQNILGDVFASLSIMLDQPFVVGDAIVVDNHTGVVEHIGLKTTRVRSLSGEQVILSNTDLLKSRVRNLKRMSERRVLFSVNVTYQTPPEKLKEAKEILKAAVAQESVARLDRVHFKELGASTLVFEVVFFVLNSEYLNYMDIQERINFRIVEEFAKAGIQFAYPTSTVFFKNSPV